MTMNDEPTAGRTGTPWRRPILNFPDPVNEVAARTVAVGVGSLAATIVVTRAWWLLWPLAYGFVARVTTGPRLSPLAQFAVRVVAPRLSPRPVPGPPKRFAQGIGALVTTAGLVAHYAFGSDGVVVALLVAMVAFATLEALFGFCVGCKLFGALVRMGWLPTESCEVCRIVRPAPAGPSGA